MRVDFIWNPFFFVTHMSVDPFAITWISELTVTYGSCSSGEEIEAQMKGFAQGYVVTLQLN